MKTANREIAFAIAFFMFLTLLLGGCFKRPKGVKDADDTRKKALLIYKANTDEIHHAEQEAYRQASLKMVDKLFEADLAEIQKHTGADGKLEAKFAIELFARAMANRDKNRAGVEAEVSKIRELVAKADRDFVTALKLDELLGQFYDAGIQPEDAQKFVDQILSVVQK